MIKLIDETYVMNNKLLWLPVNAEKFEVNDEETIKDHLRNIINQIAYDAVYPNAKDFVYSITIFGSENGIHTKRVITIKDDYDA